MTNTSTTAIERTLIEPAEGRQVEYAGLGVVRKIDGAESDGRFSVVEHSIPSRVLDAPLHVHRDEDEYSYVVEGTLGAIVGEEVVFASAGSWVLMPRGAWHALWNPGADLCRIIEVISPAGFEGYFREVAAVFEDARGDLPDLERLAAADERYDVVTDFDSVTDLCHRFGLDHPLMTRE